MDSRTAFGFFSLGILTKRRYDMLLKRFGNLDRVFPILNEELLLELGCKPDTVESAMRRKAVGIETLQHSMEQSGVHLLTLEDHAYPRMLCDIPDAPVFLSYRGDLSILDAVCIGIVGTRAMTSYGRRVAEHFVSVFVQHQLTTVSGLALGIDAIVARQTMTCEGKTVAVLGSGLQSIFPPMHTLLAEDIVQHGGLLLSEFPFDMIPTKYTFPGRNRIIAALSKGTLVIEAGEKSGALITAELAADYGREVFAIPGPVFSAASIGCNALIAASCAKIAVSPEEVLRDIGVITRSASSRSSRADAYVCSSPAEEKILRMLSGTPLLSSDLMETSGIDPAGVTAVLTALELAGVAGNTMEGWVRK